MKRPENKFGTEIRKIFLTPLNFFFINPPYNKNQKVLESHETSRKQVWDRNSKKNFLTPPINREKWLKKVKVDKVQCKPIISETVKAR